MSIIRGILPFIAYAVVSSFLDWRSSALVAAVVAAMLLVHARSTGWAWAEQLVEICGCAWFAAAAVLGFLAPGVGLGDYVGAGGQLVLAAAVAGGLAMGKPFTLPIARREAPREIWNHPVFLAFNQRITLGWALGLGVSGLVMVGLVVAHIDDVWMQVAVVALGIVVPVAYQRRAIAAFGARAQDPATWALD